MAFHGIRAGPFEELSMCDHISNINRRGFLAGLAALSGAALAEEEPAGALAIEDQQPFRGQTRRLRITRGSRPVASLLFSSDYPTHFRLKPELHNVCTPSRFRRTRQPH